MSREIKFRAWFDPSVWGQDSCSGMVEDYEHDIMFGVLGFDSADVSVMQYTGLKDKKGVEIYEGDILQNTNPQWHSKIIFAMEWESDIGAWNRYGPREDFEVAGNIHQNPELLENRE